MHLSVIDPLRNCYWCGAKSEKIFRAEDVHTRVPHLDFCACGVEHAHLFLDDVKNLYANLTEPNPQSWRMKDIVTSWTRQGDAHFDRFLKR